MGCCADLRQRNEGICADFLTEMTEQRSHSQHNCTDSTKYISINQRTTVQRLHHISA